MTNSSFASLKRDRDSNLAKLTEQLTKVSGGGERSSDDTYWSPTVDKNGNGSAVIRFLPAPPNEDVPFIRFWDHGFQGPTGQWYIEKSLTSIGQDDPVGEYNGKLWNSGREEDKETARKQKRRLHFVSNIYVVKDPGNPDNEGKVFRYKYGKKIFDKINDAMNPDPTFEEKPMVAFDLWEGANFRLRIRKFEGYRNYDKSDFDTAAPLLDDDARLEEIWKSEYSLQEILDPSTFKSYDELKRRLSKVLPDMDVDVTAERPKESAPRQERERPSRQSPAREEPEVTEGADDADMDFFRRIAEDDE